MIIKIPQFTGIHRQSRPNTASVNNPFGRTPHGTSTNGSSTAWMPALAGKSHLWGGRIVPLFAGEKKMAGNERDLDSYIRYTPFNTACPLSTWHTFATSKAISYHSRNAKVLEKYIQGTGEYYQDIPWVKHGKRLGDVPYTIFDTETTGLKDWDRIVQIAASQVTSNHEVRHLSDFNTYVNPGVDAQGNIFPIKPGASAVHGITEDDVRDKPQIEELLFDFCNNILKKNGLVVAYNAKFDIKYLNNAIDRWNRSVHRKEHGYIRPLETALVLDPFVLIQRIHPFVSLRKRLGDHYEILMGRPLENKHDAQADVDGTVDVLKYVFKYLEKHSIPLAWAKLVEKQLPKKEWDPAEKAAIIARVIRENRKAFETKMPAQPEPLKITDILRFQHGAPVYHDEPGLPKLDIVLNMFGWDGSKVWEDRNDTLDPEVAQAVREERDKENRSFIYAKFLNEFVAPSQVEVRNTLQAILNPKSKGSPDDDNSENLALKADLLEGVGHLFTQKLLDKTLPQDDKDWKAFEKVVHEKIKAVVDEKLKDQSPGSDLKQKLYQRLKPMAKDVVSHMKALQNELGQRFFYTLTPVDPQKPLIHPAVLEMKFPDKRKK